MVGTALGSDEIIVAHRVMIGSVGTEPGCHMGSNCPIRVLRAASMHEVKDLLQRELTMA